MRGAERELINARLDAIQGVVHACDSIVPSVDYLGPIPDSVGGERREECYLRFVANNDLRYRRFQ